MKKYIFGLVAAVALSASVSTASAEVEATGSVGLVSSTVWRGGYSGGPSLQPSVTVSAGGFSVTGWASETFTTGDDAYTELDYTLAYGIGGFSVAYTNYWWTGLGSGESYFGKDSHMSEVTLAYEFGESCPLAISWNTIVAGAGDEDADGSMYSTYINVSYPFAISSVDCAATVGLSPWSGIYDGVSKGGFQIASLGLTFSKNIVETENFELPMFVDASFSPANKNAYLVAGLSFGF